MPDTDVTILKKELASYIGSTPATDNDTPVSTLATVPVIYVKAAADGAAGTATSAQAVWRAPYNVRLISCSLLTHTGGTITADASNNATVRIRKADGAGGTPITMASYTSDVAGGSVAALTTKALTNVTTSTANVSDLYVPAGSIIVIDITKAGTGVVVPACIVNVSVEKV